MSGENETSTGTSSEQPSASTADVGGAKLTKKRAHKELVYRRPEKMLFDTTPTPTVDEQTWAVLEAIAPRKRVLLQYSTGKDCTAAWWELKQRGYTVVPFLKEVFPGMSFIDSAVAAHEDFFDTEVLIVPSKIALFARLRAFNDDVDLARFGPAMKDEITMNTESTSALKRWRRLTVDKMLEDYDCDVCIIGTKASDSIHRRTHFRVDGPYLPSERLFSLCWRLAKNAPFQIIVDNKIPLPRYYVWLGRSPDFMIEYEFYFIKQYYPEDYARLCELLRNLPVYVKKYELNPKTAHQVRPPKFVLEAIEGGHPLC